MSKVQFNKVSQKLMLYFEERRLKRYLMMIEEKKLKDEIDKALNNHQDKTMAKELSNIIDYLIDFTIKTYSDGPTNGIFQESIKAEAHSVTNKFIDTYSQSKDTYITLSSIYPLYSKGEKVSHEDIENNTFIKKINLESISSKDFANCLDSNIEELIQSMFEDRYGKKALFFKPIINRYIKVIIGLINNAISDVKRFSQKYEIEFSEDGEVRCLYNILNLYLHYFIVYGRLRLSKKERKLIFAASALHPVQDDYIDKFQVNEEVLTIIENKLKGNKVELTQDKTISTIIKLIDVIYDTYPIKKHPVLRDIFCSLNDWQIKSILQKKHCDEKALLEISIMKGGYAFALFGYIVLGEMTVPQFNHFFSMGGIFQLLDDFHDLEDDLETNSLTIWTQNIILNKKLDGVLNGVMAIQKEYERSTPLVTDFKYPVLIRRTELFGARYDIFRFYCMHTKYFSKFYDYEITRCFHFDLDFFMSYYRNFSDNEKLDHFMIFVNRINKLLN